MSHTTFIRDLKNTGYEALHYTHSCLYSTVNVRCARFTTISRRRLPRNYINPNLRFLE